MPYSVLPSVSSGDPITSSWGNNVAANFAAAFPAEVGAWTDYTPTLTQSSAVTKTVTRARYQRIGRLVFVEVLLDVTGTGSANNAVTLSLPVTAAFGSAILPVGHFLVHDFGTAHYSGIAVMASTTTVAGVCNGDNVFMGQTGADFAAALGSSDDVGMTIFYEAASGG